MALPKVSAVKEKLHADAVSLKNGIFTYRVEYYYGFTKSGEHLVPVVKAAYPNAEILDYGNVFKPFRGGASTAKSSHWWVRFKLPEVVTEAKEDNNVTAKKQNNTNKTNKTSKATNNSDKKAANTDKKANNTDKKSNNTSKKDAVEPSLSFDDTKYTVVVNPFKKTGYEESYKPTLNKIRAILKEVRTKSLTEELNMGAIRSDLRRYRKATFVVGGSNYELSGNIREGYNLWLLSRGTYGPNRTQITSFSTIEEFERYIEDNV